MGGFQHILFATDFGEPAEKAEVVAVALALELGARLSILHVYTIPAPLYAGAVTWPTEDLAAAARGALTETLARVEQRGATCDGILEMGTAWERIVATAKERDIDLIVVGTHGRRGLNRALLGSVAERVVRLSPVPVLTVPGSR
jgi:nucleotide-binding universal stress UspA family protein